MGMDLKSYSQTRKDPYHGWRDENVLKKEAAATEKSTHKEAVGESDVREAISHYAQMDNSQLMVELAKQIGIQKEKGNEQNLRDTIERIKPLLNDEQRKRMEDVISGLGL